MDCLLGQRGLEDGERLCDALYNLLGRFSTAQTKQHGFCDVSPPWSQTTQHLLQFVPLTVGIKNFNYRLIRSRVIIPYKTRADILCQIVLLFFQAAFLAGFLLFFLFFTIIIRSMEIWIKRRRTPQRTVFKHPKIICSPFDWCFTLTEKLFTKNVKIKPLQQVLVP